MVDKKNSLEDDKAAEGAEEGAEAGLEPPKGFLARLGKKKLILIAVAALLVLGGGGAAAFFFLGHEKKTEDGRTAQQDAKKDEPKAIVFYDMGDILVNLSGEGKRPNFLKIKVALQLESEKDKVALDAIKPRILDNFQVYLRELRMEDLKGSAGIYRLREELLLRVTEAAYPVRVRDVLFQEMLVQ